MSHHNKSRGCLYILKRRDHFTWTTHTIVGPRRVRRFEEWKTAAYYADPTDALINLDSRRKMGGLSQWGVFHRGRQLSKEELQAAVEARRES